MNRRVGSHKFGRWVAMITVGASLAVMPEAGNLAEAQTTASQELSDWLQQPTLTGNWDGVRTSLAQDGFTFYGQMQQQFGGVPSGGRAQGFDYDQQVIVGTKMDLQKLLGINGAIFHLEVTDRAGRNVGSDYVGSKIEPFNQYGAGENFRLSNMSYEQNLFDKRLNLLIGYYPDGNEFANSGPVLCAFMTNGLCGHPLSLNEDSPGEMNSPGAQWGARVKAYITPSLYNMTGVYEVNPSLTGTDYNGFKLGLVNSTGVIIFEEIGKTVSLGSAGLVGHYKVGGYYDTSTVPDIANSALNVTGRYGGYLLVDQMVYSFAPATLRGIVLFAQATRDDKRTSLVSSYYDAGIILRGMAASRPQDTLGFAWITNNVNKRALDEEAQVLEQQGDTTGLYTAEQVLEMDYNFQVGPWFSIHPTVQYWIDPGALTFKHYQNAWLFGLQTTYNF